MNRAAPAATVPRWRFGDDPAPLAAALDRGAVLAIPTESSYGLAADPRSRPGVDAILRLKGERERGARPLPVVTAQIEHLLPLGVSANDPALTWAAPRWPAALSVVVSLTGGPVAASLGEPTLAVRIPAHAGLRDLLAALGRPLTATSANRSGEPPHRSPAPLAAWLEAERAGADGDTAASASASAPRLELILVDGGELPGGPPSTLVELQAGEPRILRPGRYPLA